MADNLKEKAAKGILWKFLEQGGVQLIQFISGIYIARILLPEHYGLIGMMAIFLGISQVFIDSGFKATLIQKGTATTQDDYNVVFYFNLAVSSLFCLLIFYGAPTISRFYNEPELIPVARVLGFNLLLGSLGIIQQVVFEKRLNFGTLTKIRLVSVVISTISGIILAILGFGVWALVFMVIVENFIRVLLYWIINRWRPDLSFKIEVFNELFSKGSKILFNGIMGQLNQNIYSLVIGRYFATTDVGFYSQGRKLQQRIGDFISGSIQGVMFPVQSLLKDNIERLKSSVRKNVKISTLVAFPAIIGLIAIAKPFVLLFLTEKWLPSVYYLQVLSFAGIFFITNQSIKSYLLPLGEFNFIVIYGIISNIVLFVLIGFCIVYKTDLKWIVAVKVLHEFLNFIAVIIFSKYFIDYRVKEILADLAPSLIFSAVMGISVYVITQLFGIGFIILGLQVVIGAFIYLALNYLFNRTLYNELKDFAQKTISKKYLKGKPY